MKIVELKGTPYERGLSHGQQCGRQIRNMTRFMKFFAVRMTLPDIRRGQPQFRHNLTVLVKNRQLKQEISGLLREYEQYVERYWPAGIEEMRGITDGAKADYEDVLFINLLAELVNGCSIWAACGEATSTAAPLLGMTSDEEKATAAYEIVKIIEPEKGYKVIANSMAGWVLLSSGMNEKGLAMGLPLLWLRRTEQIQPQMSILPFLRAYYECATVDEVLALYQEFPEPGTATAQYIVDTHKVARIEWGRVDHDIEVVENGVLSNTNRPESAKLKQYDATLEWKEFLTVNAVSRQKRMKQLLDRHYGKIDEQVMMSIATDHGEGDTCGKSICQHSFLPSGVATVSALIASPGEGKVWISGCTPCKTSFQEFSL
jgi:predicted choloylglycine hydrolase